MLIISLVLSLDAHRSEYFRKSIATRLYAHSMISDSSFLSPEIDHGRLASQQNWQ
jgi:hypothetical protein